MIRSTRNRLHRELNAARREIAKLESVQEVILDHANEQIDNLTAENIRLNKALDTVETYASNLRAQVAQQLRNISDEALLRRAIHDLHERLAELTVADHGHDLPVTADTGREVA